MTSKDNRKSDDLYNIKDRELEEGEVIGKGAYGIVYKGKWLRSPCAIKKVHKIFETTTTEVDRRAAKEAFERECEQSLRLRHPNIVQFFGICQRRDDVFPVLVMELLHCSLFGLLKPSKGPVPKPPLQLQLKMLVLCDVAQGLCFLHSRSIIHRDLSSNNVLIRLSTSEGMTAKIGDLGTMRCLSPEQARMLSRAPGTIDFMPPEALVDDPIYDADLDVFSFACVALHTLSGEWPAPSEPTRTIIGKNSSKLVAVSEAGRREKYLVKIKASLPMDRCTEKDINVLTEVIIKKCLNNNRKKRPSSYQVSKELERLYTKMPKVIPMKGDPNYTESLEKQIAQLKVIVKPCKHIAMYACVNDFS